MVKFCQKCGCELSTEYKFCSSCKKENKREYARNRYKQPGFVKKRYGETQCIYCGKTIIKNRPNQDTCFDCYKQHHYKTIDNYNSVKRSKDGKYTIAREKIIKLGFKIPYLCVHHKDCNPNNNNLNNLIILNRSHHARLHKILEKNWSLLSKDSSSNLKNCWNTLIDQLTTAYLEINSANVIKITDIGQSAAEPLKKDNIYIFEINEEGSETMH